MIYYILLLHHIKKKKQTNHCFLIKQNIISKTGEESLFDFTRTRIEKSESNIATSKPPITSPNPSNTQLPLPPLHLLRYQNTETRRLENVVYNHDILGNVVRYPAVELIRITGGSVQPGPERSRDGSINKLPP